jgi:copper oxidase (laccase) domain-containing protein
MLTDRPGLLLAIATADCVPVLLARRDGREVAALHVGWRGAHAGIVDRFAALVRGRGGDPGDWVAAIGPAAQACCYEVSAELIDSFHARTGLPRETIAPRRAGSTCRRSCAGSWRRPASSASRSSRMHHVPRRR